VVLVAVSLGAAGLYTALVAVGYWQTVTYILMTAGAFFLLRHQRFDSSSQ
jgi:hypothetical protein